jgi:glucose/arabinose dehydrogenase
MGMVRPVWWWGCRHRYCLPNILGFAFQDALGSACPPPSLGSLNRIHYSLESTLASPLCQLSIVYVVFTMLNHLLFTIAALQVCAIAQSCGLSNKFPAPLVADGYEVRLIAQGLAKPRGIIFDDKNNLLVVERGVGITSFTVDVSGNCVTLKNKKTVVSDNTVSFLTYYLSKETDVPYQLNHGIELTDNGKTLYASSLESVLKYAYDSSKQSTSGEPEIIVNELTTKGTVTRTLLLARKAGNKLLVSRGGDENIDLSSVDVNGGEAQIRIFDPTKSGQTYTSGTTLGWGLRNAVGVAENPKDGGIWSAENNADNIERDGFEIHENNPAEELNYHGVLSDTNNPLLNKNYGYPLCYGAWNVTDIPSAGRLQIGQQFAIASENSTNQDAFCNTERQAPRLVFQPHTSPLDMKFDGKGENLYITLHGSWNKEDPVGYSVSVIKFGADGQPIEASASTNALTPILSNSDTSGCPGFCFRPVGLAWDRNGRLYMTSDNTGEIYIITKSGGKALDDSRPSASGATVSSGYSTAGIFVAIFASAFAYLL